MNVITIKYSAAALAVAASALLLGACASPGGSEPAARLYDLGYETPPAKIFGARIGQVRANAPFDGTEMQYRLAYRDKAELFAFSQSRWAASPAELVRKRFVRTLEPAPGSRCVLDVEVNELSQVFSAREASEALLELRALLADGSGRVAERTVRVSRSNAGANAAHGAAAMAQAADDAISQVAAWIEQQPGCKTR
jgi:cholesterol transport system auxiliary component